MKRSIVAQLPEEIRTALDRQLVINEFSDYAGLANWLAEKGYQISRSSVHRYGKKFQQRLDLIKEVTEQARALSEAAGDDENALGDALTRLTQQKAFEILLNVQEIDSESIHWSILPKLGKMIADLNRSGVTVKRYRSEMLEKLKEKLAGLEKEGKNLDPKTLQKVREEIYGIF